ncbi:divergent PAP2 family protein [Patescibacteria group bacterium]|nr:divergent PAP2 family protein [Patescibacteria group bacterium]MBU4455407.1 divergent PAP2 family protein [Patescibacteria group bacterium]MCG2690822.1 divergent PAP2 family protein [Candidatus Parcubacteria bacterium]MDP3043426.1 divergent PAP2 family protein [bacterium]
MSQILLLPLIAGAIAQIIKFFIGSNEQKISFKNIMAYSGMPSGHSAIVISLATIIALKEGWQSPLLAVSVILAIIVIRDALGIRRYLGEHGRVLNVLVKDLGNDQVLDEKYPRLLERVGHTPMQVFVGALIGFFVSLAGFLLLN